MNIFNESKVDYSKLQILKFHLYKNQHYDYEENFYFFRNNDKRIFEKIKLMQNLIEFEFDASFFNIIKI